MTVIPFKRPARYPDHVDLSRSVAQTYPKMVDKEMIEKNVRMKRNKIIIAGAFLVLSYLALTVFVIYFFFYNVPSKKITKNESIGTAWIEPNIQLKPQVNSLTSPYKPERSRLSQMVFDGMNQLRSRKIDKARALFQKAYDEGYPYGAIGMMQSYDLTVLKQYGYKRLTKHASRDKVNLWEAKANELFERERTLSLLRTAK